LSIAPLDIDEAQRLIETFVALERLIGDARLLIDPADCDSGALETLERDRRELELHHGLVLLDETRVKRYAAYRAASIACSLGLPLPDVSRAVEALWFDLPVVAFDDAVSREVLEPCSFLIDTRVPREIAAILKVLAGDSGLRAAAIAEGRRIRERYAPATVSSSVLDALSLYNETSTVRLQ
jgi:glycosyltransferase involved in cell wall biosynthesis